MYPVQFVLTYLIIITFIQKGNVCSATGLMSIIVQIFSAEISTLSIIIIPLAILIAAVLSAHYITNKARHTLNKNFSKMSNYDESQPGEEADEQEQIDLQINDDTQANGQPKQQKIYKKYRPRVFLGMCKYPVVHELCNKKNIKECADIDDWNLFWYDWSINNSRLQSMRAYQKINHFPNMDELTRKDFLCRNMQRAKKVAKDEFAFFPMTFQLPQENFQFQQYFNSVQNKKPTFISKPNASCQGKGMKLFKSLDAIDLSDSQVVQEYIGKPYLINGLKFDLRLYVVLLQVTPYPLILFYEDGMARFCTDKYQEPTAKNLKNTFMHLTNYALNKNNPNFQFNKDQEADDQGSKWGLGAVWEQMTRDGCDVPGFRRKVYDVIIKTIMAGLPQLQQGYGAYRASMPRFGQENPFQSPEPYFGSSCFEILGYDILVDENFQPILLEVNHSPSFTCGTPLDLRIKQNLISNVIDMLWITQDDKILNQKLDEIKQLRGIYKMNTERDRELFQQKSNQILKRKGKIKTFKKMPTYASCLAYIEQIVQKSKLFVQIYPLYTNTQLKQDQQYEKFINNLQPDADPYMDIFFQIKNYESMRQGQKTAPRPYGSRAAGNIGSQPPKIPGRSTITSVLQTKRTPQPILEVKDDQLDMNYQQIEHKIDLLEQSEMTQLSQDTERSNLSRDPSHAKLPPLNEGVRGDMQVQGTSLGGQEGETNKQLDQQQISSALQNAKAAGREYAQSRTGGPQPQIKVVAQRPVTAPGNIQAQQIQKDPLRDIYQKMVHEMEFGSAAKQVQFRGVVKPVYLNQGSGRNEKIEKTVQLELGNRLRSLGRIGVREQVEQVIRIGQRGVQGVQTGKMHNIDVFAGVQGVRSKSGGVFTGYYYTSARK